ncbi:MAG: hypothetical protein U0R19_27825 [Bryobacteraceae bacterium]
MADPSKLAKAQLVEVWPGSGNKLGPQNKDGGAGKTVTVQFNPQSLKVSFANQNAGGDQPGKSSVQFVGKGTTKLSMELWFDVTLPLGGRPGDPAGDVRKLTEEVAYFMRPQEVTKDGKKGLLPPGVRLLWGSFLFEGVMDSLEENLEYFSEDGRPLRASLSIALSKQEFQFAFNPDFKARGVTPLQPARPGQSLQSMAGKAGNNDWKKVAAANSIENPRQLPGGTLVNLSAGASLGISASAGLSASASVGLGISGNVSLGLSGGASFGAAAGAGIGVSAGAGVGVAAGAGVGISAGAGFGAGAAVGGSAGASVSGLSAGIKSGRKLGFGAEIRVR